MRNWLGLTMAALAVAFAILGGLALLNPGSAGMLEPDNRRMVAKGEAVYSEKCASCHGPQLEGQPDWTIADKDGFLPAPPHDESGHTWHHPDRLLFDITKVGVAEAANLKDYDTRMPAFGDLLTDDDILAVLSFIKSTWPEEVRRRHDELNTVYQQGDSAVR